MNPLHQQYIDLVTEAMQKRGVNIQTGVKDNAITIDFFRDTEKLGTAQRILGSKELFIGNIQLKGRTGLLDPLYAAEASFAKIQGLVVNSFLENPTTKAKFEKYYTGAQQYMPDVPELMQWKPPDIGRVPLKDQIETISSKKKKKTKSQRKEEKRSDTQARRQRLKEKQQTQNQRLVDKLNEKKQKLQQKLVDQVTIKNTTSTNTVDLNKIGQKSMLQLIDEAGRNPLTKTVNGATGKDLTLIDQEHIKKTLAGSADNLLPDKYVVFDIETTGLNKETDRVIQFAMGEFKDGEYKDLGNELLVDDDIKTKMYDKEGRLKEGLKVSGLTQGRLELEGKDKKAFKAFAEKLAAISNDELGTVLVGYNTSKFDIPFIEAEYERLFGNEPGYKPLNINKGRHRDIAAIAKAARGQFSNTGPISDQKFLDEIMEMKRSGKFKHDILLKSLGFNIGEIEQAFGASLHDAKTDIKALALAVERLRVLKKEVILDTDIPLDILDDLDKQIAAYENNKVVAANVQIKKIAENKAMRGHGFWVGAVGTYAMYSLFGRAPIEETMEKVGGKQDSPIFDAMLAGGAAFGINHILKHHKSFPNLPAMFSKAMEDTVPNRTYKSQLFKFGGIGLAGYSAFALAHNAIYNEPGEGWRYPLLTAGVAGAAVYSQALYNDYKGDIDHIAKDAKVLYNEMLNKNKNSGVVKSVNKGWANVVEGKAIPGDNKAAKAGNAILTATAKSGFGKIAVGVGLVASFAAMMTGDDNSQNEQPIIQTNSYESTGFAMDSGYNRALSESATNYRPARRYNQSYRGTYYGNQQPHGLGLV